MFHFFDFPVGDRATSVNADAITMAAGNAASTEQTRGRQLTRASEASSATALPKRAGIRNASIFVTV